MDTERTSRLQSLMAKQGIDILLCRLPENVVYATGYWPVIGASLAVVPASGDATLIMPYSDWTMLRRAGLPTSAPFALSTCRRSQTPPRRPRRCCETWRRKRALRIPSSATRGISTGRWEQCRGGGARRHHRHARAFQEALPQARFVDATDMIKQSRIIKSKLEIEQIRITNEVASMGYDAAREMIAAG